MSGSHDCIGFNSIPLLRSVPQVRGRLSAELRRRRRVQSGIATHVTELDAADSFGRDADRRQVHATRITQRVT